MSTAERTRTALRRYPFLGLALRAGVLNYRATARFLDSEDVDAVAAALRRQRETNPDLETRELDVRIRLRRNVTTASLADDGVSLPPDFEPSDQVSAVIAMGDLRPAFGSMALLALALDDIRVEAHTATTEQTVVVVSNDDAASALRTIEAVASAVPTFEDAA